MTAVRIVPLGDIATVERASVQPSDIRPGTLYVGLEDIESGGGIVGARPVNAGDLASTKFSFTESHVLYGKLRPYLAKIAAPQFAGICSTDIVPVLPGPLLDRRYLLHYLRQPTMVAFATARSVGVNLPRLRPSVLETFPVPLPPLPEQRRVAAILDQADDLRAKRRATLGHLNALKESIFLEMFAGSESEEWPLSTIEDVADPSSGSIRTGPFGSQLLHSEFVDDGVAVLGIDNAVGNQFRWAKLRYISHEKYKLLARYTVHPGDLVITIMGTCGRCAIVPDDIPLAINTKHLCCITLNQTTCLPIFLHSYFQHHPTARQYLRQTAKGAVMDGLNMAIIRQLPLRLPPLPLQKNYGRRVTAIESVEVALSRSLAAFDDLFASLRSRAFRGEL